MAMIMDSDVRLSECEQKNCIDDWLCDDDIDFSVSSCDFLVILYVNIRSIYKNFILITSFNK